MNKVPVELDRPRTLLFDLEALERLEAMLGNKAFGNILNDIAAMGITALQLALLTGLAHEDPTLNRGLLRKILQQYLEEGKSLQPIGEAVNAALEGTGVFRMKHEETGGNGRGVSDVTGHPHSANG